jgi:hypothetical protein
MVRNEFRVVRGVSVRMFWNARFRVGRMGIQVAATSVWRCRLYGIGRPGLFPTHDDTVEIGFKRHSLRFDGYTSCEMDAGRRTSDRFQIPRSHIESGLTLLTLWSLQRKPEKADDTRSITAFE